MDRHYGRAVFRSLWERIEALVEDGRFIIVDEAVRECNKSDAIQDWLSERPHAIKGGPKIWQRAAEIIETVERDHNVVAVETRWRGAGAADPLVIALAEEYDLTVITSEKRGSPVHPKIPIVCEWRSVVCVDLFGFFKLEDWEF